MANYLVLIGLLLLIAFIGLFILVTYRSERLIHLFLLLKYELIYNAIGFNGLLEDIVMKEKNKIELCDHSGKVALITGGSRGIGANVVKMLLQCNMHVINGCRDVKAAEKLLIKIRKEGITTGDMEAFELDTSSMESVKQFANDVKKHFSKIHILINNAGKMFGPYIETVDGYESQFATNYLGHFYLTHLLFPTIKAAGSDECHARIVNVSSCAHLSGQINFNDINCKQLHIPSEAYAQSKLAQILFSNYLNQLMKHANIAVESYSVHPGIVNTELFNDTTLKRVAPYVIQWFFKTAEEGARSIMYAAIGDKLMNKGGTYITNCQDRPATKLAYSLDLQKKLFNYTMEQLNINTFGKVEC